MALTDYRVLTPERVSLQYDIAGIGSRCAAALIDAAIQGALLAVVGVTLAGAAALLAAFRAGLGLYDTLLVALFVLAVFAVTLGYYIVFEILWSGQTPGKRITGIRVLRENGYPIRPVDAVIRNLVRLVDGLPVGYAVGVLTMLLNARAKRLGDFAAGTIVVREGGRGVLAAPDAIGPDQHRGPALRTEDATLVRDFLFRRSGMDPDARHELAMRLARALAARYGLGLEADPERFLEALAG
jgi:uncharacterized RDD family membrane protein YckC